MLINLIAKRLSRNPIALAQKLAELELGFHAYCDKMACRAQVSGNEPLAAVLSRQAFEEKNHAKMLAGAIGQRMKVDSAWSGGYRVLSDGKAIVYYHVAGISRRYWVAKIFFNGQKAEDLEWADALAMMATGERMGTRFYRCLYYCTPLPLSCIAYHISQDEENHCHRLVAELQKEAGVFAFFYLLKWRLRAYLVLVLLSLGLPWITL